MIYYYNNFLKKNIIMNYNSEFSKLEKYFAINKITVDYQFNQIGLAHQPMFKCNCIISKNGNQNLTYDSNYCFTKKDSKAEIKKILIENKDEIKQKFPTNFTHIMHWHDITIPKTIKIFTFDIPPYNMFNEKFLDDKFVGVDFEGSPPCLAQISCEKGIVIDSINSPIIQRILQNDNLTHFIFGGHEKKFVKNPFNIQEYVMKKFPNQFKEWSLTDSVSLLIEPTTEFIKDKNIHLRNNWKRITISKEINKEALNYAATDAWVTFLLGKQIFNK